MAENERPVIVWFRQDLRLADNPALAAAAKSGRPLLPVYILDETPGSRAMGGASRWWLAGSLARLAVALAKRGAKLLLRRGPAGEVLSELVAETNAASIHWSRCYEPGAIARDKRVKAGLTARGISVQSHNAALLAEPWNLKTGTGEAFKVFTPFWAAFRRDIRIERPLPTPKRLHFHANALAGDELAAWRCSRGCPEASSGLAKTSNQ